MKLTVYTDGSGTTRGPGGIAYVAYDEHGEPHSEGSLPLDEVTNQKAEILAAAYALHCLPEGSDVVVVSDSEYVVKGFSQWLDGWKRRGWIKSTGGAVANRAHWTRLDTAAARHSSVSFEWVAGHSGIAGNERADKLAGEARQVAKARAAEARIVENEAAFLADVEAFIAETPGARWVVDGEAYDAERPQGRRPFDLDAHVRKIQSYKRVDEAIADMPVYPDVPDPVDPNPISLFDVPASVKTTGTKRAQVERDNALGQVDRAADPEWRDDAYDAVVRTARALPEFISDDVWTTGGLTSTKEDRALGPVMVRIARDGIAEKTDRVRPSVRSHLSGKPVWRSLVYEGASSSAPTHRAA